MQWEQNKKSMNWTEKEFVENPNFYLVSNFAEFLVPLLRRYYI